MRITRGNCPNQGDCNFEDGTLCEYENLNEAEMKWTVRRGSGPNAGTGLYLNRKNIKKLNQNMQFLRTEC